MKIEKLYKPFRYYASKRKSMLEKNDSNDWNSEWKKFRYNRLSSPSYEKKHSKDFRKKQKEAGYAEGIKGTLNRLDYMLCWFFTGAVPEDYFSMVFKEKGWRWRNHHVTRMRLDFFKSKMNSDSETMKLLNDKVDFCNIWGDTLHKKWCVPEDMTAESLAEEFKDIDKIIVKKRDGFGGKGITLYDTTKMDYQSIYDEIMSQDDEFIIEEFHTQTGWLHEVNPSSLNTIRVATVRIDDNTDAIFSYLRVGINGSYVDNLHSGGIRFPINHNTGMIYSGMNYKTHNISKHPDSGIQLEGETMPKWNEIIEFCKKAHERAPDNLHWIGWDVCLDEDDISMVEGNAGPGFPPIADPKDDWWGKMKIYLSKLD